MTRTHAVVAAAPGSALGPAWRPRPAAADVAADVAQVRDAFTATALRLEQLAAAVRADGAAEGADILEAEALIARDPSFVGGVVDLMPARWREPATALVREVAQRQAASLESLESEQLRARAADVRQVGRMVVEHLTGSRPVAPDGDFVLVDDEVTAPDLLEHADQVVAAVSARGGANSHAAIVARSLGIPLVVQAPADSVDDGALLLVDADAARLVVSPDEASQATARAVAADRAAAVDAERAQRTLPAETVDGVRVTLLANVASGVEARRAVEAGCDGVGLLRTELGFLDAHDWPRQAEHDEHLAPVLAPLAGLPVTVRLLDFTNDKKPAFADASALGLDGLLAHPDALDAQLAAIVSAGRGVDLRVLVPMVVTPDQVLTVRLRLSRVADRMGVAAPSLGPMVELPDAARAAADLAEVSDFLSLGTNDLTAAALGLDRTDPRFTATLTLHPAVLDLVDATVRAGVAAGVPVSVCGDAAADPSVLPVLLGAGVRAVSVAPSRLAAVRTVVRQSEIGRCVELFEQARSPGSASGVRLGHAS